jgi:hypothetical protein
MSSYSRFSGTGLQQTGLSKPLLYGISRLTPRLERIGAHTNM